MFTELDTVEHYVIEQLTGVNLNRSKKGENTEGSPKRLWTYVAPDTLNRRSTDILLEQNLAAALRRLNPFITTEEQTDAVIRRLRTIIIGGDQQSLVYANETFTKWLRNEESLGIGEDYKHETIRLIDYENIGNNEFIVTNQFVYNKNIPDLVLFVNGIPLVVGECKTAVRPSVSWADGAHDIHAQYEVNIPQLFVPNVFSFATDGKGLYYGSVRMPLDYWSPWRLETETDTESTSPLAEVGRQIQHLLTPSVLLDILRYFTVFARDKKTGRTLKAVARYQQYEGANGVVKRVMEGRIRKGLIWHFQGSGKSLLMLFAAQKLRNLAALQNPTVLIVVDRIDLDSQISGTFDAANIPNMVTTDSIDELRKYLKDDTRKIIVTTIHKFRNAPPRLNERKNIIVMVDEAHRTQEGNLGGMMRAALPNAFLFGLTGTPINRTDKNTFWTFGAEEDKGGYMSRYSFQDSIRDKATLPLHFEPRLLNIHIKKEELDAAFALLTKDIEDAPKAKLSQQAAKMSTFLKSPQRIEAIAKDVVKHFKQHLEPQGFKAMLVAPDREACTLYKTKLDELMGEDASAVVMSGNSTDTKEFIQKYVLDKDGQEAVVKRFDNPKTPLKFLIVTAKLLTGFDSPILQTMYLDKALKDHTLLQAICRTNRLFPNKTFGQIVDYFGVFDDTAKALKFDEEVAETIITHLKIKREQFPELIENCLRYFTNVDRTETGFDALQSAQECLRSNDERDAFGKAYCEMAKIWEALSPDAALEPFREDYKWLSRVYESIRPASNSFGRLIWLALGAQTTQLIHEHIEVKGLSTDMDTLVLDAAVINDLAANQDATSIEKILRGLNSRFSKHGNNPVFKALSIRLDELRLKAELGLIQSADYLKGLLSISTDAVEEEKKVYTKEEQKTTKSALTELFLEAKTDKTPIIVERIVNDIDSIVEITRFAGWQDSIAGRKAIEKALRDTLRKYELHKNDELMTKAYGYLKGYY